jgi:hypothetical protein
MALGHLDSLDHRPKFHLLARGLPPLPLCGADDNSGPAAVSGLIDAGVVGEELGAGDVGVIGHRSQTASSGTRQASARPIAGGMIPDLRATSINHRNRREDGPDRRVEVVGSIAALSQAERAAIMSTDALSIKLVGVTNRCVQGHTGSPG